MEIIYVKVLRNDGWFNKDEILRCKHDKNFFITDEESDKRLAGTSLTYTKLKLLDKENYPELYL